MILCCVGSFVQKPAAGPSIRSMKSVKVAKSTEQPRMLTTNPGTAAVVRGTRRDGVARDGVLATGRDPRTNEVAERKRLLAEVHTVSFSI